MQKDLLEKVLEYKAKNFGGTYKKTTEEDLSKLQFALVFGDPRGDKFIKEVKTKEELIILLDRHLHDDTGCDFPTEIYYIIADGKEADFTVTDIKEKVN